MIKKIIIIVLCIAIVITSSIIIINQNINKKTATEIVSNEDYTKFTDISDPNLLEYIKNNVYMDSIKKIYSDKYVVEDVRAVYISKEYLDAMDYNSKSNIYFGYTLEELENYFDGKKYVFTLSDQGTTIVEEAKENEIINTSDQVIKNMATGTGVILVCVTVSAVAPVVGMPAAFTAIVAAGASSATAMATNFGAISGISSGLVTAYQTGDIKEGLNAAAINGSEGFRCGAIIGAVAGSGSEAFLLKSATKSGLTMSEVALIQKESNLPLDVISELHSMEEYKVYQSANLKTMIVNNKTALVPKIDLNYQSELPDGTKVTNLTRMQKGYAPIESSTNKVYQLHHIGQKTDGTLAVLTEEQHQGNSTILNILGKQSEINRDEFQTIRKAFWKDLGSKVAQQGGF